MANPVLVEVLRGDVVESRHRGSVSVVDADGAVVMEAGDVDLPVFPRSAVKAIQALPFVESGAADAYGFGDREIALACASHSGEPGHVELASSMLARAGLDGEALECGAHWPTSQDAMVELARSGGSPRSLHNNCSGKHSGFLCTCCHMGVDHHGYVAAGHAEQELVREALESVTCAVHEPERRGTDGCSIPTYAVPLKSLAFGFARMATGNGLPEKRARAARRILTACMAEPFFMSGTGRNDLAVISAGAGRVFVKTGAEGVYCGAIPELGLGIALKCDDGTSRASETAVAAMLASLLSHDEELAEKLRNLAHRPFSNWRGIHVGDLRPAGPLAS